MLPYRIHGQHRINFMALHTSGVVHNNRLPSLMMSNFHIYGSLVVVFAVKESLPLFSFHLLLDLRLLLFIVTYGHEIVLLILNNALAKFV